MSTNNVIKFPPRDAEPEDMALSALLKSASDLNRHAQRLPYDKSLHPAWLDTLEQSAWEVHQMAVRYRGGACGD